MAVRIQLASNFQVVELTYDDWNEVNADEVEAATELVNKLGKDVVNDIKTSKPTNSEKKEEMITDKQKSLLVNKFGVKASDLRNCTKKQAWEMINELKDSL